MVDIPLMLLAGLVGISRTYHNQHWASDVAAGAVVASMAPPMVAVPSLPHAQPAAQVARERESQADRNCSTALSWPKIIARPSRQQVRDRVEQPLSHFGLGAGCVDQPHPSRLFGGDGPEGERRAAARMG